MIAGVVLSGGQSIRMGQDKSELKILDESLLNRSKNTLKNAGIADVFISGKNGIQDLHANKGPLAGIFASLDFLMKYDFVLFTTVDMPFVTSQIYQTLIKNIDYKNAHINNNFFPMLLCNSRINRKKIFDQLCSNDLSIKSMLNKIKAHSLKNSFSDEHFFNANTPQDWQMVIEIANRTNRN